MHFTFQCSLHSAGDQGSLFSCDSDESKGPMFVSIQVIYLTVFNVNCCLKVVVPVLMMNDARDAVKNKKVLCRKIIFSV
jgi:hypothetical protein